MKTKIQMSIIIVIFLLFFTPSLAQSFQVLERMCKGSYVIAKVKEVENTIGYRILEFCPFGCEYGICLSKREIPKIKLNSIYEVSSCNDNIIFVEVTNEGTKGELNLKVEGEAKNWIKIPSKVSLSSNETKTIAIVASIPCNVTGTYSFILVGSGATDFYAPSTLRITESGFRSMPVTTSISPISFRFAILIVIVLIFILLIYKIEFSKKPLEESFKEEY
ncbi:MAG: hypothetical protein QXD89_00365 [Candidatus Aenigmatarchaeota archaeon]